MGLGLLTKLWPFQVKRDSGIHMRVSILLQNALPSRLPHNIEQSFMCYTVGPYWLSCWIQQCVHDHTKLPVPTPATTVSLCSKSVSRSQLLLCFFLPPITQGASTTHIQHAASCFHPLAWNFPSLLTILLLISSCHQCIFRAHLQVTFSMLPHLISPQAGFCVGLLSPQAQHTNLQHTSVLSSPLSALTWHHFSPLHHQSQTQN